MYPVLVQIGTFEFRSYGVFVALAFLLGLWFSTKEAKRRGLDPELIADFGVYALVGGIVGARLYFVVFSDPAYFLRKPWEILAVWHGGLGILGALFGGFLTALWYCRRKKISIWRFADTLAPGVALGQAAGVIACLLNGDSFGKPAEVAWAITYTDPRAMAPLNVPLHPVELYEMAAYFLVFLLLWQTRRKFSTEGFAFLTYLVGYGAARLAVEFFRGNPAVLAWDIPAAQIFGMALIVVAIAGFYVLGEARARRREL
jgi:phosphatidylglycerol:prolipoprotein diacylglycerol transferase